MGVHPSEMKPFFSYSLLKFVDLTSHECYCLVVHPPPKKKSGSFPGISLIVSLFFHFINFVIIFQIILIDSQIAY